MDENEGVNLTYVYEGTTATFQYDTGRLDIVPLEPQRTNFTYEPGPVDPTADQPTIIEKKKPEEK